MNEVKASGLQFSSNIFSQPSTWHTIKSRDMVNLDYLEKGLEIVFPPHFVYDFSTEMCLMLYSIN